VEYCTNHVLRAVVQVFVPVVLEAVVLVSVPVVVVLVSVPVVVVLVSAVGAAVVGRE
jgi:hypothetical protein